MCMGMCCEKKIMIGYMECVEYEVEGSRPERTWREVVQKDTQARKLNGEDAMDCGRWRKQIKDG